MSLSSVINTFAANMGVSKREAAALAAKHGRAGLANTLNLLSDALDGRRLGSNATWSLPTPLATALARVLDKKLHGPSKPPNLTGAAGGSVFRTRPAPQTVGGRGSEPPLPGEEVQEFMCPNSSNLYSVSFVRQPGQTEGDLYVTFKSVNLNTSAITKGTTRKGKSQSLPGLIGTPGKTVAGGKRQNTPGSRYRYFRVGIGVYQALKDAHSRGEELWNKVRVRGSISGTRYQYVLASPDVNTGAQGSYIPRRATRAGFRSRSLNVIGGGFLTSTLQTASNGTGFTTRPAPGKRGR